MHDSLSIPHVSHDREGAAAAGQQTESGLTLSLSKLLRDQLFRPGCASGGSIVWTNTRPASASAQSVTKPVR